MQDEAHERELSELLHEVRALRQTLEELKAGPGLAPRLPPDYAVLVRATPAFPPDYAVAVRQFEFPPDYAVLVRPVSDLPPEYEVAVRPPGFEPPEEIIGE
jgi:hypothetical protein